MSNPADGNTIKDIATTASGNVADSGNAANSNSGTAANNNSGTSTSNNSGTAAKAARPKMGAVQIISIILFGLFLAGSILLLIIILRQIGWSNIVSNGGRDKIQEYIAGFGAWKDIVYTGLIFLAVIFAFIPNNVLGIAGGLLFGLWKSFFLTVIGTMLGCILVFWIARALGRPIVEKMVQPETLKQFERKLSGKSNILFVTLMLIPFVPSDIVCYAAGLTKMRFRDYVIMIALTRPWGILLSAYMGSGSVSWWQWLIIFAALAIVLFLIIKFGNRIARRLRRHRVWSPIADAFDEMGDLSIPLKINPKPAVAGSLTDTGTPENPDSK